jgi:hypothetical protein
MKETVPEAKMWEVRRVDGYTKSLHTSFRSLADSMLHDHPSKW